MQLFLEKKRVRAQRNEFLARDNAFDDLADFAMNEGLASRNGDHRRAAFVDRVQTFLHRKPLIEDRIGIIDFAATGTGQIATKQRLQHQHERVAPSTRQPLFENVSADLDLFEERYPHGWFLDRTLAPLLEAKRAVGPLR